MITDRPTCATCPFRYTFGFEGSGIYCVHDAGTLLSTADDRTCANHPDMGAWLDKRSASAMPSIGLASQRKPEAHTDAARIAERDRYRTPQPGETWTRRQTGERLLILPPLGECVRVRCEDGHETAYSPLAAERLLAPPMTDAEAAEEASDGRR